MTAITQTVEIDRAPDEVFAYVTDFSHFPEWQEGVLAARPQHDKPLGTASAATVTRRAGPRTLARTERIVALDPPRAWEVRGEGGPVASIARGRIDAIDGGRRSRLTISLDFQGRGIGKLIVPLVVRPQARKQLPANEQTLKKLLERGT